MKTTREAAEYLGQSPATLRSWRHRGIGPPFTKPIGRGLAAHYQTEDREKWKKDHHNGR